MVDSSDNADEIKAIGARIRKARLAKGLSQEAVGLVIGKSQRAMSQYESGTRRIFADDILKIAQVLNVPVGYLLGETQLELDEVDTLILNHVQQIESPKSKNALLAIVREFVNFVTGTDK